jgi:DNA-binding IclR family transcriptional regulator
MVAYAHELGDETGEPDAGTRRQSQSEVLRVALPALPEICAQLGKCVGVSVWGNRGPITVRWELCPDPPSNNLLVGFAVSLINSATGRAFAAFLPRDVIDPVLNEELAASRAAGSNVPSPEEIDAQIAETRAHGLARRVLDHQPPQHADIDAFSAPVYDRSGTMALALTVPMRVGETGPEWDGPLPRKLADAALTLSRELGYRPQGERS